MSVSIANITIPKAGNHKVTLNAEGGTNDIVQAILFADSKSNVYTADFAKSLKQSTVLETAKKVFDFVHKNIKYKLDPAGEQWVKSPAQTWNDKYADCKSMSIFSGSIFKNLGIPYAYRFTSYGMFPNYTHVYIVVKDSDKEIIVDPVYGHFNKQKKYKYKKDYWMTQISYISGIENDGQVNIGIAGLADYETLTEAEARLGLISARLEAENESIAAIAGKRHIRVKKYLNTIKNVNQVRKSLAANKALNGGKINKKLLAYQLKDIQSRASRIKGFDGDLTDEIITGVSVGAIENKRITSHIKKGGYAGVRLNPAMNLVLAKSEKQLTTLSLDIETLKQLLESDLPTASVAFLYVFIKNTQGLPSVVVRKRERQLKALQELSLSTGLSFAIIMEALRTGITIHFKGRSPEAVLRDTFGNAIGKLNLRKTLKKVGTGIKKAATVATRVAINTNPITLVGQGVRIATGKQKFTGLSTFDPTRKSDLKSFGTGLLTGAVVGAGLLTGGAAAGAAGTAAKGGGLLAKLAAKKGTGALVKKATTLLKKPAVKEGLKKLTSKAKTLVTAAVKKKLQPSEEMTEEAIPQPETDFNNASPQELAQASNNMATQMQQEQGNESNFSPQNESGVKTSKFC